MGFVNTVRTSIMTQSPDLYNFKYEYDKPLLVKQALDMIGYAPFTDPLNNEVYDKWLIKHVDTGYGREIANEFSALLGCKIKARFYRQYVGYTLDFHKDRGTLCSINFVLNDNPDPIRFRYGEFYYTTALLNVQAEHAVSAVTKDRLLFKLSIFDLSYETVKLRLIEKFRS